jgi:hypothetical protein
LPDGIFSNQKSQLGLILDGLAMEDVGIFYGHYGHLVYYVTLWQFYGYLCSIFFPFWYVVSRKIWQP